MSNIIHSKPYRNWVRGALGLSYVQEGLYPFTDRVVKAEHSRILQNLAPCNSCTIKKIQPVHAKSHVCIHKSKSKCNCRQTTSKACNTCSEIYDKLIIQHRFRDPFWVADAGIWCSDHWQIAKCFMTSTAPGSNNTAADTDAAGLLSIITNALFFQSEIQCNINPPHDTFSQVRDIRNTILHKSTPELSDTEVTRYLHAMIAVLEDQTELINDPSAQAAVEELKKIVNDQLVVTTKEEARAIQTAADAIKEVKEQCEESIKDLTEEKRKEFYKRNEKSEDRLREIAEEGEILVKKTKEQCEESIKDVAEEKLKTFNERKEQSENQLRELTEEGENVLRKTTEQCGENLRDLTEDKLKKFDEREDKSEKRFRELTEEGESLVKKTTEQCKESLRDLTEEKLRVFNDRKENSEDRMRHLTIKGENVIKKATEQSEKCIDKLTEEKQTLVQLQALEAVQKIKTAVAENEPEYVTNLKIKHVDHEKRINAEEKKQSDLEVKQKTLEKKVDLLGSAQDKHQTRIDYLKQKQALQRHLVELYQKHYVKTWLSPLRTQDNDFNIRAVYVSPNMVVEEKDDKDRNKPEEFNRNETDLTRMKTNKVPDKSALRHINRYQDMFGSRAGKNKRIFIVGDVGTGKTSFCKMMMQNWCTAVTGNSEERASDNNGDENVGPYNDTNTRDISAFELLFYVPLQFMSGKSDEIIEMIKKQLPDYSTLIDKIFSDESDSCLILADGLDEWAPPRTSDSRLPHETYGLPTSHLARSATIISTSRPSARGILDMKSSECDLKVNLLGVNELVTMIERYMTLLGQSLSLTKDLHRILLSLNLGDLQKTPMLLQQITWMYCNKYAIDKSITYIYTNIVNVIFKWMHKKSEEKLPRNTCTSIGELQLPNVFEKYSSCQENRDLIILLGKVAYDILIAEDRSSLVLDRYRLKQLGFTEEDISAVVQVGVLHEVKSADPTYAESQLSFIHTSYPEFFAAVFISSHCLSQNQTLQSTFIEELILRKTSAAELLQLKNVLIMVCGLSPFLTDRILECIRQVACTDKHLKKYRKHHKRYLEYHFSSDCRNCYHLIEQIQDTCFRLVSEANSTNKQQRLRVNIFDCIVYNQAQLEMCLSSVESVSVNTILICLRTLSHEQCNSLSSFLSKAVSLQKLHLDYIACEQAECDGHSIELSHHEKLQSLLLQNCAQASVSGVMPFTNLKSCTIEYCNFSHKQLTSFSSSLSQSVSLQYLHLLCVACEQAGCDGHSIDLSRHEQLQNLLLQQYTQVSVSGIMPTTNLKSCEISEIRLSHKQCTSLLSFLSQAVSLQRLYIADVTCEQAGCDSHSIDLSHHEQLQNLQFFRCNQISVSGVMATTNLKSCEISHSSLSHEQLTSLSSFLSQSVSLQRLHLKNVKCTKLRCDGHRIDLSRHEQLQSLQLPICNKIYVSGVVPITNLKSCEISDSSLSHEQCTELSSFLSQSVLLQSLYLAHITCEQAGCDGHRFDLSRHEQLQSLQLHNINQISVSGVMPTTNIMSCDISFITLSHEQCKALSSFFSQAVSLQSLHLAQVTCERPECDGHNIDLSHHEKLQSLQLERCIHFFVSGVMPTTNLKSCKISEMWLSHEQYISLSSFLSQSVSLQSLHLEHIICLQCGCNGQACSISLSRHEQLQNLHIHRCYQLSVSGVMPATYLKSCKISTIRLSHERCTSLSSFLSQSVSLQSLYLDDVTCLPFRCDGHRIDLSHHEQLQSLQLQRCDEIYVSGVMATTYLKSCKISGIRLSHEQCTSLTSFLSKAVSLQSLCLDNFTCKQVGCDGHLIDLSHHKQLQSLYFYRCTDIFVYGLSPSTNLSCNILLCVGYQTYSSRH